MEQSKIIDTLETYQQYMSMSHGYSTIGGIEGGSRQKGERNSHLN